MISLSNKYEQHIPPQIICSLICNKFQLNPIYSELLAYLMLLECKLSRWTKKIQKLNEEFKENDLKRRKNEMFLYKTKMYICNSQRPSLI